MASELVKAHALILTQQKIIQENCGCGLRFSAWREKSLNPNYCEYFEIFVGTKRLHLLARSSNGLFEIYNDNLLLKGKSVDHSIRNAHICHDTIWLLFSSSVQPNRIEDAITFSDFNKIIDEMINVMTRDLVVYEQDTGKIINEKLTPDPEIIKHNTRILNEYREKVLTNNF